jgi:hypothetical protein
MPTPILDLPQLAEGQALPATTVNEIVRYLEWFAAGGAIEDRDQTDPTAITPADGQAWLIAASAIGAWSGKDGQIALYVNTAFVYIDPVEGMNLYVKDENVRIEFDGASWAAAGGAGLTAADVTTTNTGTSTTTGVTPDALAGSRFGTAVISILVSDPGGDAITTGDGKAYWRVPSTLNGMDLVAVAAAVTTVSSSGAPTVQVHNVTQAADMLSTAITIDASETDSATAATPAVIDTANDDVATGDMLRIDIDAAGTGAKGLMVELQFRLP